MGGHQHRSSGLKQSNKSHKSSKASKRSHARSAGGKIQSTTKRVGLRQKTGAGGGDARANRAHMAQQRRIASRAKLLQTRRLQGRAGGSGGPAGGGVVRVPRMVGLVSLSEREGEIECGVRDYVVSSADCSSVVGGGSGVGQASVTATYARYKKEGHLTFLSNSTAFYPLYEQDGSGFSPEDASVQAALDLSRVCDTIVFLLDGRDATSAATHDDIVSRRGDRILAAIKAQGLPTPLTVLVHVEQDDNDNADDDGMSVTTSAKSTRASAAKKRADLKRYVSRFATTEFGERATKVLELDLPHLSVIDSIVGGGGAVEPESTSPMEQDAAPTVSDAENDRAHPSRAAFLRTVCTMKATPPRWVSDMPRAYLVSEGNGKADTAGYRYDASKQELQITGFLRGKAPWNVNDLAHLPNVGTFRVGKIERAQNSPTAVKRNTRKTKGLEDNTPSLVPLLAQRKDNAVTDSLDMFASPDALDGEQNLIGFDEDAFDVADADDKAPHAGGKDNNGNFQKGVARPAGWSDYQSAWMDAIPDEDDENAEDHGELAFDLNRKDAASVATAGNMDATDAQNNTAEERRLHVAQRLKEVAEERTFPDEVEVEEDVNARDRFARYRSLKSFRKSYWDAKENLPTEYGRIFHFGCFRATQGDVMRDMEDVIDAAAAGGFDKPGSDGDGDEAMVTNSDDDDDILEGCVPSGSYVTLTLQSVPRTTYANIPPSTLLTAVSLLPHENKLSVIHMSLAQPLTDQPTMAIKSKDPLSFRCGWRTWNSRPVFSQNNLNCDKQKFERFMPGDGAFFAASVLGPVTYGPCPVLVFRAGGENGGKDVDGCRRRLVALGSMMGADADRIVVKRIILTGYPTRVHKRNATIKYMFYNPDDVNWFTPAGLSTKHGLQGNILESVGDHGTMKCLFNAPIKQHDTVCLPLYKRIYPKYEPSEVTNDEGQVIRHDILVL